MRKTRIADLIEACETRVAVELSIEELASIFGASGGVPYGAPQYDQYASGQELHDSGSDRYTQGLGAAAAGALIPVPVVREVAIGAGAYRAWTGADMMQRGNEQMAEAQHSYDTTQAQLNNGGMSSDYDVGPNMSYAPNMTMSDGSPGYDGVSVLGNQAGMY
jgi:hypothetical protein